MPRIAVPMIGGMVSSTVLTLRVIPAIYGLVKGWRPPAAASADKAISEAESERLVAAVESWWANHA